MSVDFLKKCTITLVDTFNNVSNELLEVEAERDAYKEISENLYSRINNENKKITEDEEKTLTQLNNNPLLKFLNSEERAHRREELKAKKLAYIMRKMGDTYN